MEWTEFWLWLLTAVVGGTIVKVLDWVFNSFRQSKQRKEEMVRKVEEQLITVSKLIELYSFFAQYEEYEVLIGQVPLETGQETRIAIQVTEVKERQRVEPDLHFDGAIEAIEGAGLHNAIAQRIVEIRLGAGRTFDLTNALDPSGKLNERFQDLYDQLNKPIWFHVKQKNFESLVDTLDKARQTRNEIYSMLQRHLK